MDKGAHLAGFLLFDIVQRIEILYFAGESGGKPGGVELLDIVRSTLALQKRSPGGLECIAYRRNQTETGDDDATIQNQYSFRDRLDKWPASLGLTVRIAVTGSGSLRFVLIDIIVRVAHALNFFRILVRNFNAELFFEAHHQLDSVERVGAEVIDEPGIRRNFVFVDAKLVHDNLFYFLLNLWIGHSFLLLFIIVRQTFSLPMLVGTQTSVYLHTSRTDWYLCHSDDKPKFAGQAYPVIASRVVHRLALSSTFTQRRLRSIWRAKPLNTLPGPISIKVCTPCPIKNSTDSSQRTGCDT